jgi:hypothetical protein
LLGVVDFCIFPHLGLPDRPDRSMAEAQRWGARIKGPGYAMDAQTAIKVTGDGIEVVSEGHWKLLNPASLPPETVSLRSKSCARARGISSPATCWKRTEDLVCLPHQRWTGETGQLSITGHDDVIKANRQHMRLIHQYGRLTANRAFQHASSIIRESA